ncbi:DUF2973 domain-containing protein [Geitlerinema sp. PCC 9228]|jgi:hypothetical protein|uniref:DUF2973 domain-containing protein n=1 Tax=Geitlerinema sp. PCC 9228 TaxID=111611 RepID=UPI0008F9E34A|nr:DUF2973 domain-containing protein [Geitlerinema sp. PCC 9228]
MLHLLYILAFTVLAFLAVGNLIRSLMSFSRQSQRHPATRGGFGYGASSQKTAPHPELLDERGQVVKEPLMVLRSMDVEDAREQLDAIYKESPGHSHDEQDEK